MEDDDDEGHEDCDQDARPIASSGGNLHGDKQVPVRHANGVSHYNVTEIPDHRVRGASSAEYPPRAEILSSSHVVPAPCPLVTRDNPITAMYLESANGRGALQRSFNSMHRDVAQSKVPDTQLDTVHAARRNAASKNNAQRAPSQIASQDTVPNAARRESALSALEDLEALLGSPP